MSPFYTIRYRRKGTHYLGEVKGNRWTDDPSLARRYSSYNEAVWAMRRITRVDGIYYVNGSAETA